MATTVDTTKEVQSMNNGTVEFDEKILPTILHGKLAKLDELNQQIKKAITAANKAKSSADRAKQQSAGWLKKKAAIEELQAAGIDLAEAIQSSAEAQKVSFELQTKLAEITKYLFGLGVSNIAANRIVVRELEFKLKGASKEKLSELAHHELLMVVKQLKDQQDILIKQENTELDLKEQKRHLREQEKKFFELTERIDNQTESLSESIENHVSEILETQKKVRQELSENIEAANKTIEVQSQKLDGLAKDLSDKIEAANNSVGMQSQHVTELHRELTEKVEFTHQLLSDLTDRLKTSEQASAQKLNNLQRNIFISIGLASISMAIAGWVISIQL